MTEKRDIVYRSRAPVRVDFAGGWTDVALFAKDPPGAVVNAAVSLFSYVTIIPGAAGERGVNIYSSDYEQYVQAEDVRRLEYDGNIDLVKAAIKKLQIGSGLEIITQSTAPAGSGLGTSASMGVALIGALSTMAGRHFLAYEAAELASTIEREELGIRGGKQDHYTSALGSFRFLEFFEDNVKQSLLHLNPETELELEKNLVLCYTGKSRLSGDVHKNVADNFVGGVKRTRDAIQGLKRVAVDMKDALLAGALDDFARLMDENWRLQKELHPSVTNQEIDRLFELARHEGAIGGKACGAGGGGCLIFYCSFDAQHRVRKTLEKAGAQIIDFQFAPRGLETWVSHHSARWGS